MEQLQLDNMNYDNNINGFNVRYDYWGDIEKLNWYENTKHYGYDANTRISEYLMDNFTIEHIIKLKNFVVEQRQALQNMLRGYFKASPTSVRKEFILGDDAFWDFASHIVGMGRTMFMYVYDHPEVVLLMQKDYQENFEYGFDYAISAINNETKVN